MIKIIAKELEKRALEKRTIKNKLSDKGLDCLCRSIKYYEKKNECNFTINDIPFLEDLFDLNKFELERE